MTESPSTRRRLHTDSPLVSLAEIGMLAQTRMKAAVAVLGLTPRHLHLLTHLVRTGSRSQQSLVEHLCVDPSVLVTLLNDLERAGWARRRRDPNDRRRHIVELSEQGEQVTASIEDAVGSAERELLADLDDDEVVQLQSMLGRIRGRFAPPDGPPDRPPDGPPDPG